MSQKITAQEGPFIPLYEAVAGALDGKDDHLLSLDATGQAVLFTGAAPAFAVMVSRPFPGSRDIQARLLTGGGTCRMIQNAAITPGARVAGVNANARVTTVGAAGRSLGFKLSPPTAGAAGDVIEVAVLVEHAP